MTNIYSEKNANDLNYELKEKKSSMGHSNQINEYNNGILADSNELVIEIVRPKSDLSVWHKICFAAAGLPFQMYSSAYGFFVNVFLLDSAQLTPDKVLYVLFISR